MRSLQKFAAVHASVYNQFNQERSLSKRTNFKLNCAASLAEWRGLCATYQSPDPTECIRCEAELRAAVVNRAMQARGLWKEAQSVTGSSVEIQPDAPPAFKSPKHQIHR
jgi:hypothetical protein